MDRLKANSMHSSGLIAKVHHYACDLLEDDLDHVVHFTSGVLESMQGALDELEMEFVQSYNSCSVSYNRGQESYYANSYGYGSDYSCGYNTNFSNDFDACTSLILVALAMINTPMDGMLHQMIGVTKEGKHFLFTSVRPPPPQDSRSYSSPYDETYNDQCSNGGNSNWSYQGEPSQPFEEFKEETRRRNEESMKERERYQEESMNGWTSRLEESVKDWNRRRVEMDRRIAENDGQFARESRTLWEPSQSLDDNASNSIICDDGDVQSLRGERTFQQRRTMTMHLNRWSFLLQLRILMQQFNQWS